MSFDSLSLSKPSCLLWRAIIMFVSVGLIVLIGSRVPLLGIDTSVLAEQMVYSSNGATVRFSIFALGVMPLFTALAHVEIAKLIFPSLARWQIASSGNAFRISLIIKSIVLLLTAIQGYGMMSALAAMDLVDGSPGATSVGIVSFVGSVDMAKRHSAVSAMDWLIATPVVLLAVWMIIVANALLSGKGGVAAPTLSLAVLLWPPFLASIVAG